MNQQPRLTGSKIKLIASHLERSAKSQDRRVAHRATVTEAAKRSSVV